MIERSDIDIRVGGEADFAAIARVLVDTWRTTFRTLLPDAFLDAMSYDEQEKRHRLRALKPQVSYIVAVDRCASEIIGFANGGPPRGQALSCDAELYALYVGRPFQGQGVGAKLLRAFAAEQTRFASRSMFAWVLAENPNRHFYERMGAKPAAISPIRLGPVNVDQVAYVWRDFEDCFR